MTGAKAGEERQVKVTFPDSYGVKELAGKPAEFEVKVSKVEAPKEQVVDDEFAKKMGFEDLVKFKDMVKIRIGHARGARLRHQDAAAVEAKGQLTEK